MKLSEVISLVGNEFGSHNGRLSDLYDFIILNEAYRVLELGTGTGKGACIMAAAIDELQKHSPRHGLVMTVDLERPMLPNDPSVEELANRCGLYYLISPQRDKTSYVFWLAWVLSECKLEPFDLIYLDGSHYLTEDAAAFSLAEHLLRPGGWFLFDDYGWAFSNAGIRPDGLTWDGGRDIKAMSAFEFSAPHVKLLYDLIVKRHPRFHNFCTEDNWWMWAQKRLEKDVSKDYPA